VYILKDPTGREGSDMDLKWISRLDKAIGNFGRMPYRISNGEYLFEAFVDTLKENVMTAKILILE
jgi:hypothetical protein